MKTIKEGHFEDKMHVKCSGCEAEYELTSKDIKWMKTSESIWGTHYYDCPKCKRRRYLESSEMTRGVAENLKR